MKETIPNGWKRPTLGRICLKIDSSATLEGGQESYNEKSS
jgi:hypothetical protein